MISLYLSWELYGVEKINYMLRIDILRNSSQKKLALNLSHAYCSVALAWTIPAISSISRHFQNIERSI